MSRRETFLVFGSPLIAEDGIAEIVETLRSGWIGTGPRARQFEEAFLKYAGSTYAVAVNSCTAALHLALLSAGVKAGDEVITTPMTFCATANTIIHCGGKPIFADCNRDDFNIDPDEILKKITERTRAIVPVHFAGRPCAMDRIMQIANDRGLAVIEDCAHAIETTIGGRHVGTFGAAGCFSFYVTKNVVCGDGGMVVTNSAQAADHMRVLSLHGMSKDAWSRFSDVGYQHYEVLEPGFKYNMIDLLASLGLRQLEQVEARWKRREQIWNRYQESFTGLPCQTPVANKPGTRHAYHLYTLLLDIDRINGTRDDILDALAEENIGTGVHYISLHLQPYYAATYGLKPSDFPNAAYISERTLSLPLSPSLTDADVTFVVNAVRKVLSTRLK